MLKYFLLTSRIARQAGRDKKRVERRIWRSEYKLVLRLARRPENAYARITVRRLLSL